MSQLSNQYGVIVKNSKRFFILVVLSTLLVGLGSRQFSARAEVNLRQIYCTEPNLDVATPLNDLGGDVYIRMDGQNTGEIGGLYPGGSNVRPPEHEAAGQAAAAQIVPLDTDGNPDEINGKIVLVSIGMSNTAYEFNTFIKQARDDPEINHQLVLVNGAQSGQTADRWIDPDAPTWQHVYQFLNDRGVTPAQVQVAWVKLTHLDSGDFPSWPVQLQNNLEIVTRNLKTNFPNIKIAYYSSRTRAYIYWSGLNPEPSAYESGFSVRWMIEKQINGDPSLNFDPNKGAVVAPYLSWGAYLWIDGENPRSDGRVWLQDDLAVDCVHPSKYGRAKVAEMLMDFFKSDTTTVSWFLENSPPIPSDTPTPTARVTLEPTSTITLPTNTPTVAKLNPKAYIPVVFQDGIRQESVRTSIFFILMLAGIGVAVVIKVRDKK